MKLDRINLDDVFQNYFYQMDVYHDEKDKASALIEKIAKAKPSKRNEIAMSILKPFSEAFDNMTEALKESAAPEAELIFYGEDVIYEASLLMHTILGAFL